MAAEVQPSDPATARPDDGGGDAGTRVRVEADADPDVEAGWMVEFARGDTSAFERIVKTYEPRIHQFLLRKIRDPGRAEDLTQEVFLRVYRARDGYRPTAKLRTWLYTIASRLALNELRALRRRRRVFAAFVPFARKGGADDGDAAGSLDDLPIAASAFRVTPVVETAEGEELAAAIEGLLWRLPTSQRTAIELLAKDRLSYAEIAAVMGVTVAAVRSLIVRARRSLREGLGPHLGEGAGTTEVSV